MKKNWTNLFLLMAISVMPLTSCEKNEEPQPEEEYQKPGEDYVEETRPVTAYDGLSWLQNNLVVVDANGEVIRRVYGKPLDASQQTVISVPVNDLADADSTFLRWVAPGKEVTKVDGGYDYNLTDRKGNAQGAVSFRAVEDEAGVIARLSVAPGTVLKLVTEVLFIDAELWPENADYQKVEKTRSIGWKITKCHGAKDGPIDLISMLKRNCFLSIVCKTMPMAKRESWCGLAQMIIIITLIQ